MKWLPAVVFAAALLGCAGGARVRPAPEWIANPPEADGTYLYFTGAGTSKDMDQALAEQIARGVVIDEIMRYVGVSVTSETAAEARASVDSFKSSVLQTITQSGSGRIAGLEIRDKYVEKGAGGTTVYLLAGFNKTDLAREKRRIEEVFQEQQRAITAPEAEARALEARGDYYAACVKYIEAAGAASRSTLENARIKFERDITAAMQAMDRVSLVKLNDNLETAAGSPFAEAFSVKVVGGASASDPGVPEAALKVSYVEIKGDRKQIRTASVRTNAEGVASFSYPVPDFVGPEKLTMAIDLAAYLDTFGKLPREMAVMVSGLEDIAASKKAVFSLAAFSAAKELPAALAVACLDAASAPVSAGDFSAGILKPLTAASFTVKALSMEAESIVGQADSEIIAQAAAEAGGGTARLVFGTARIEGTEVDGAMTIVKASAAVKVADMASGGILLSINKSRRALGKSEAAAVSSAFRLLGQDVGQEIANRLR